MTLEYDGNAHGNEFEPAGCAFTIVNLLVLSTMAPWLILAWALIFNERSFHEHPVFVLAVIAYPFVTAAGLLIPYYRRHLWPKPLVWLILAIPLAWFALLWRGPM